MFEELKRMDMAYAELRTTFIGKSIAALPDPVVQDVIAEAARRGLWTEKNAATLERMRSGGPLGNAFAVLTAGNAAILQIVEEQRRVDTPSQLKGTENATESRIGIQPDISPSPKRGRPPKHRV